MMVSPFPWGWPWNWACSKAGAPEKHAKSTRGNIVFLSVAVLFSVFFQKFMEAVLSAMFLNFLWPRKAFVYTLAVFCVLFRLF
jgi:hypothetical protein